MGFSLRSEYEYLVEVLVRSFCSPQHCLGSLAGKKAKKINGLLLHWDAIEQLKTCIHFGFHQVSQLKKNSDLQKFRLTKKASSLPEIPNGFV